MALFTEAELPEFIPSQAGAWDGEEVHQPALLNLRGLVKLFLQRLRLPEEHRMSGQRADLFTFRHPEPLTRHPGS